MESCSASLVLCEGNSPVTGEFSSQRPVTRSFDAFFDLHLNKRLSKPSRRRWFETPSRPLWRNWKMTKESIFRLARQRAGGRIMIIFKERRSSSALAIGSLYGQGRPLHYTIRSTWCEKCVICFRNGSQWCCRPMEFHVRKMSSLSVTTFIALT